MYVMSVSAEHIVVREPTNVMLVRVADQLPEIQRAWASFEVGVGPGGRKFYGVFDPVTDTYSVCAVLRPGDDPSQFGAERGTLPGGRYACVGGFSIGGSFGGCYTRLDGRVTSARATYAATLCEPPSSARALPP